MAFEADLFITDYSNQNIETHLFIKTGLLWTWSVMNRSVMTGSVTTVVCYERDLLRTGVFW